jgi:hypothetical protein
MFFYLTCRCSPAHLKLSLIGPAAFVESGEVVAGGIAGAPVFGDTVVPVESAVVDWVELLLQEMKNNEPAMVNTNNCFIKSCFCFTSPGSPCKDSWEHSSLTA